MTMILANSITPIMMRHLSMLLVGNAIIGIIEGVIIARIFKASHWKCVALMITANYLSMWVGAALFGIAENPSPIPDSLFAEPLYSAGWLLWICLGVALLLSIILEWPFCFAAMKPGARRFRQSILASLVAQASRYTCIGLSFIPSSNSLNVDVAVVRQLSRADDMPIGEVLFISPKDGDVYSVRLHDHIPKHRFEANLVHRRDALGIAPDSETEDTNRWQLHAHSFDNGQSQLDYSLSGHAEPFRRTPYDDIVTSGWWLGFSGVADLRPKDQRQWKAKPNGNSGLRVDNSETGQAYNVTYETVFTSWWGGSVSILPGDIVIFEFGEQICILDMLEKQITLLCVGRGPVVILDPQD